MDVLAGGHLAEVMRMVAGQETELSERLRNTGREARWPRTRPGSSQREAEENPSTPSTPGEGLL